MPSQQLLDYIRQQTALGKPKEDIKAALKAQGWQEADIEAGFAAINSGAPAPAGNSQLTGPSQLLKQAWTTYKQRFGVLFGIYLIAYAVITGLLLLLRGFRLADSQNHITLAGSSPFMIILLIVVIILIAYLGIWSESALLFSIKDSAENIGVSESYKRGAHKIKALFIAGLLTFLAVLGGTILLIIPGIIFAMWFSQSSYVVVTENLTGRSALSQSKRYVKGRFWPVFWRFFYLILVSALLSIAASIVAGILFGSHNETAKGIINGIFSVIWSPLAAVYCYLLYQNLKNTSK